MNKPWEINAKTVLVMSDAHQRISWIHNVLEHERGNFDRFLFNGDIIHTRHGKKDIAGTRDTAKYYRRLIETYDVNMGNHELPIMESWRQNTLFKHRKNVINNASGYTKSNSLHFNREISWGEWRKVTLFRLVNGWLVSHAGIGMEEWNMGEYPISRLWYQSQEALENVSFQPHDLFRVGPERSNRKDVPVGGPLWRDWNTEFKDELPYPQLVGHTSEKLSVRQIGRSFNIDGEQTTYALIHEDASIEFKALVNGTIQKVEPIKNPHRSGA